MRILLVLGLAMSTAGLSMVTPKKNLGSVTPEARPRTTRRLRRVSQDDAKERVSVYYVGEEVVCEDLLEGFRAGQVRRPLGKWRDELLDASVRSVQNTTEVYVFAFGCVVLWGFDKPTEREIVSGLLATDLDYVHGKPSAAERVEAHDTMLFEVADAYACRNDKLFLSSDDPIEKFALSFALAQSAKLFVWESRVASNIDDLQDIPDRLATTGKTYLTEQQISKKIGQVFLTRAQVNLRSDILDSPDYFWEDARHETKYLSLYEYLDVPDRVDLLNQRLDVLKDLLEVLNTQLTNRHSSNLEVIIILLILVEIAVSLFTFTVDHLLPAPLDILR